MKPLEIGRRPSLHEDKKHNKAFFIIQYCLNCVVFLFPYLLLAVSLSLPHSFSISLSLDLSLSLCVSFSLHCLSICSLCLSLSLLPLHFPLCHSLSGQVYSRYIFGFNPHFWLDVFFVLFFNKTPLFTQTCSQSYQPDVGKVYVLSLCLTLYM